ncbi:Phage repressor protein C, contains Cro/C1-type HTH and peptisase s24 domains [Novosphingobium sp. CF614]|uniref:XRE family transcriptional regulator n=1 Tax=Novosphingobium sp. CF614 TaxID=1884364 RepID=UPI0008E45EC0|nr:S24 family peptidase [Novosphingobium sp. CF614]SFG08884.1 Phage repressor protein C, contains Cro/C1-type HTH and peptisase s24 domains [Novosphingobium sp. CF614]
MNAYTRRYNVRPMWEIVPARLQAAMRRAGVNQSQLAGKIGVTQPSIARLLRGETKTTRAMDVMAAALDTTAEYLKGEVESPERQASEGEDARPLPNIDDVEIDEIDLAFGLGFTFIEDVPVKTVRRKFSRSWLRMFTDSPASQIYCARGLGDSMTPTILDSDILIIDAAQRTPRMAEQIWAVSYCGMGSVKRLRPTKDGGIKIMSDKVEVSDEVAYDDELHILGRVVAVVRKM